MRHLPLALLFASLLTAASSARAQDPAGDVDPPKVMLRVPEVEIVDAISPPETLSIQLARQHVPLVAESQSARRALLPLVEVDAARRTTIAAADAWVREIRSRLAAAAGGQAVDQPVLVAALDSASAGAAELRRALPPAKLARLVAAEASAPDGTSIEAVERARGRALGPIELQHRAALAELFDLLGARTTAVGASSGALGAVDTLLLALVLVERADAELEREHERYDRLVQKNEAGALKELPEPPVRDLSRAIELLTETLGWSPDFEGADGAWYLLGWCHLDEASASPDPDEGVAALQELVARFPDSELAPAASMMLVEQRYARREWSLAARHAARIVDGDEAGPFHTLALTRAAMIGVHLATDLDGYAAALATFARVLDASNDESSRLWPDLAEWAAFCLVAVDARDETVDVLRAADRLFARSRQPPWEREVLVALAELLGELARYDEAIAAEAQLQERWPLHPDNPRRQARVAELQGRAGADTSAAARAARWDLVERYDEGTAWWQANAGRADALERAAAEILSAFTHAALAEVVAAQETGLSDDHSRAADRLAAWLVRYPDEGERFEMRWFLGSELAHARRLVEAATVFRELLSTPGHRYGDGCRYQLAWALRQQAIEVGALTRGAPSPEVTAYVEAVDELLAARMIDPVYDAARARLAPELRFEVARLLLTQGQVPDGRERLEQILKLHPSSEVAGQAAWQLEQSWRDGGDEAGADAARAMAVDAGIEPTAPPPISDGPLLRD